MSSSRAFPSIAVSVRMGMLLMTCAPAAACGDGLFDARALAGRPDAQVDGRGDGAGVPDGGGLGGGGADADDVVDAPVDAPAAQMCADLTFAAAGVATVSVEDLSAEIQRRSLSTGAGTRVCLTRANARSAAALGGQAYDVELWGDAVPSEPVKLALRLKPGATPLSTYALAFWKPDINVWFTTSNPRADTASERLLGDVIKEYFQKTQLGATNRFVVQVAPVVSCIMGSQRCPNQCQGGACN